MFADARAELRRVGCNSGTVDGYWTSSSQKALELFNKHAGLKLDVKAASIEAAVEARTGRICPLICETGLSGGCVPLDEHPVQLLRAYEIVLRLVAVVYGKCEKRAAAPRSPGRWLSHPSRFDCARIEMKRGRHRDPCRQIRDEKQPRPE